MGSNTMLFVRLLATHGTNLDVAIFSTFISKHAGTYALSRRQILSKIEGGDGIMLHALSPLFLMSRQKNFVLE